MRLAYVDTSCLVALAFDEPTSPDITGRLSGYDRLLSSNLLEAEFRSALVREGVEDSGDSLLSWMTWIYPDRSLRREFLLILRHGYITGADLWHLACALLIREQLRELTFLTLDRRQEEVAVALGFSIA